MTLYSIICVVFAVMIGSCVGSFLNVVVWRLPNHLSLIHPGSFCPKCGHPIRLRDNVPVLAWLLLRGKCRDCRAPISGRYPLIEFVCGAVTLVLALKVFFFGWLSIPGALYLGPVIEQARRQADAFLAGELLFPPPLEAACFAGLLCVACWSLLAFFILAAGLIQYDRHPVPKELSIAAFCLLAASLAVSFWRGGPAAPIPTAPISVTGWGTAVATAAAGALLGLLLFGRARWAIGVSLGALIGSVLTPTAALCAAAAALAALGGLAFLTHRRLAGLALFIGLLTALLLSPLV